MIYTLEEAIHDPPYRIAVMELLFQLADDDFILAYRGSEWLGLAPHIEEDVAFSSISQDTMGHAAMFYQLLQKLGAGEPDVLAHDRAAKDWRNSILVELVNGPGTYLTEPQYDWAFAVVRNYFYVVAKKIKMEALKESSYKPLAEAAVKVNMELYYHLLHWKTWFRQLMEAGGEARVRMEAAVYRVYDYLADLFSYGEKKNEFSRFNLIANESQIVTAWVQATKPIFESVDLIVPSQFGMKDGNGRKGEHTQDLHSALGTLNEVYKFDPAASW